MENELKAKLRRLEERLHADPIVSDDIKELASCVRAIGEYIADLDPLLDAIASRPAGKVVNVTYGK